MSLPLPFAFRSLPHLVRRLAGTPSWEAAERRPALFWLAVVLLALAGAVATPAAAAGFGFDELAARARAEAGQPHQLPAASAPAELKALDYDAYRDIRRRADRAIWRDEGLPFELVPLHLGAGNSAPVSLHEVTASGVRRIGFDAADYDYGANLLTPSRWGDIGHAGFRIHFPLNTTPYKDELIVFLGASYFRALGRGQQYGLSARGLGIDTGTALREEFPRFKAFWIVKPQPGATTLTIYGLLDSPRSTGAFEFTLQPGESTAVDVRAQIFLREGVQTLAIAPLTSMYHHGENQPRAGDFRPEVHDSDGLAIAGVARAGSPVEWLWRPLVNPAQPLVSSFAFDDLRGFGLLQRDRAFASYEDLEAGYHRRPSAWIEPLGHWGAGRVELLQLPTPDETHDNIAAYWVPQTLPPPGEPLELRWRIRWQGDSPQRPPHGWTLQSRRGDGWTRAGARRDAGTLQYVVDFAGPAFERLPADAAVEVIASTGDNGELLHRQAHRNEATGGWRMVLRVRHIDRTRPLEIRAALQNDKNLLTETWTSLIPAD